MERLVKSLRKVERIILATYTVTNGRAMARCSHSHGREDARNRRHCRSHDDHDQSSETIVLAMTVYAREELAEEAARAGALAELRSHSTVTAS